MKGESILKLLEDESVFSIRKKEDGQFDIFEECDTYFSVTLTREQFSQLIKEMTELLQE